MGLIGSDMILDNSLAPVPVQRPESPKYNFEIAQWIAIEHASGDSLKELHNSHPEIVPNPLILRRWRRDFPAFDLIMTEAECARAEILADQTIMIADDPDYDPKRAGQAIRARQWLASRLDRSRYGDSQSAQVAPIGEAESIYSDEQLQSIIRQGLRDSAIESESEAETETESRHPAPPPRGRGMGVEEEDGSDTPRPKIFPEISAHGISTNTSNDEPCDFVVL